jgi:hypothetical protein
MRQISFVRPPLIAAWLVDLVTPYEQAESISGDLLEEFSGLASKTGVASARRWYWRQSVKTIAHLAGTTFRVAPWWIAGALLLGFLLRWFGSGLPEETVVAILRTQRPYSNRYVDAYILFLTWGMLIAPLIQSMVIGCIVAVVAKGREMVATMTLCLVFAASTAWALFHGARLLPENAYLLPFLVHQFSNSIMIVIGGLIVRESRLAMARRTSGAS